MNLNSLGTKKLKVKIFTGSYSLVEKEINAWLDEVNDMTIYDKLQSGEGNSLTISIWYS